MVILVHQDNLGLRFEKDGHDFLKQFIKHIKNTKKAFEFEIVPKTFKLMI